MTRAIIELLITVFLIIVARALLTNFFKGLGAASASAYGNHSGDETAAHAKTETFAPPRRESASELHKDPVCGTYVVDSTPFRRQTAGKTFFYCSENCREKHAMLAR